MVMYWDDIVPEERDCCLHPQAILLVLCEIIVDLRTQVQQIHDH